MKFFNKKTLSSFIAIIAVLGMLQLMVPQIAYAANACDNLKQSLNIKNGDNLWTGLPKVCTAGEGITLAINLLLAFAGSAAIIFIIIGGYQYIVSGGNSEQAEKGKNTLQNAVIGLVVILLSFLIVRLVSSTLTSGLGGAATSSSGNGAPSGSGTSGRAGGGTVDVQSILGPLITIPNTVATNGTIIVSFAASRGSNQYSDFEVAMKQLSNDADPFSCKMSVVAGSTGGESDITKTAHAYGTSVSVKGPFAEGSMNVKVYLCDSVITEKTITVTPAAGVDPRGGVDNGSVDSTKGYGIYDASAKTFSVYVFIPNLTAVKAFCGDDATEAKVTVYQTDVLTTPSPVSISPKQTSTLVYPAAKNVEQNEVPNEGELEIRVCGNPIPTSVVLAK